MQRFLCWYYSDFYSVEVKWEHCTRSHFLWQNFFASLITFFHPCLLLSPFWITFHFDWLLSGQMQRFQFLFKPNLQMKKLKEVKARQNNEGGALPNSTLKYPINIHVRLFALKVYESRLVNYCWQNIYMNVEWLDYDWPKCRPQRTLTFWVNETFLDIYQQNALSNDITKIEPRLFFK